MTQDYCPRCSRPASALHLVRSPLAGARHAASQPAPIAYVCRGCRDEIDGALAAIPEAPR